MLSKRATVKQISQEEELWKENEIAVMI